MNFNRRWTRMDVDGFVLAEPWRGLGVYGSIGEAVLMFPPDEGQGGANDPSELEFGMFEVENDSHRESGDFQIVQHLADFLI